MIKIITHLHGKFTKVIYRFLYVYPFCIKDDVIHTFANMSIMTKLMILVIVLMLLVSSLESYRFKQRKASSCSWAGHCAGASCKSNDDCSDVLECKKGRCGGSTGGGSISGGSTGGGCSASGKLKGKR
jgi:hypothetical protein